MTSDLKTEKEKSGSLDQIILGIAHELNNPNTFIRLNVSNLKKMFWMLKPVLNEYAKENPDAKFGAFTPSELQSKVNQTLESIMGATVRIIVVADKLKQCTSNSLEQSATVSLLEVLRTTLQSHQFLLERCTNLDFTFDENDLYNISGYRLQLEQAVSIVITNACDAIMDRYGEEGSEKSNLNISLEREGEYIKFQVSDDGCGMTPEVCNKVFNPYFTTKPQGAGDGLGLPICQSIVTRHGGNIQISSQSGQGTDVIVKLQGED